uniref:Uncharacterized protein n=1 Tax=Leersia perrieri TaxID=77586 RepID=A0A0D9VN91_9ORYZ
MTCASVLLGHSPSPLTSQTRSRSRRSTTVCCRCSQQEIMAVVKAIRVHELGGPEASICSRSRFNRSIHPSI